MLVVSVELTCRDSRKTRLMSEVAATLFLFQLMQEMLEKRLLFSWSIWSGYMSAAPASLEADVCAISRGPEDFLNQWLEAYKSTTMK